MRKDLIVEKILNACKLEYRTERIRKGLMRNNKDNLLKLLKTQESPNKYPYKKL